MPPRPFPVPNRPPSAVFARGHAFSVDVSSESKLSSEPSASNAARLWRAGGLHSSGGTPSSAFFPAPTPHPPALGKPRWALPTAPFRGVGVNNTFAADCGLSTVLEESA